MPIAVDPTRTVRYVLAQDRQLDLADQTVFLLRPLTAREFATIEDAMSTVTPSGEVRVATGSQTLRTLEVGLTGWENFKTPDGVQVPFRHPQTQVIQYEYLRPDWRRELANEILGLTRVTDTERKN